MSFTAPRPFLPAATCGTLNCYADVRLSCWAAANQGRARKSLGTGEIHRLYAPRAGRL